MNQSKQFMKVKCYIWQIVQLAMVLTCKAIQIGALELIKMVNVYHLRLTAQDILGITHRNLFSK